MNAEANSAVARFPRSFLGLLIAGFMLVALPLLGTLLYSAWHTQRLTEQGLELFGGMGIVQGMPIEKYVRDAHIQKHISFPFPSRFKVAEALAGYKRKIPPFVGVN